MEVFTKSVLDFTFLYLLLLSDACSPDTIPLTDPVRQLSIESPVIQYHVTLEFYCYIGQFVGSVHNRITM